MLHTETRFPFPGSIADHDGERVRVQQALPDGISLVLPVGGNFPRRVPTAELIDPATDEPAIVAGFDRRRALWIARHLRDANDVGLGYLDRAMTLAARLGHVPIHRDTRHLAAILRRLNWQRDGYTGAGYDRTPRYVRAATALREVAA